VLQSSRGGDAAARQEPALNTHTERGWLLAFLIAVLSGFATLLAWNQARDQITARALDRFTGSAEEIGQCLRFRMQSFEQVVRGAQGLFRASDRVEHRAWHDYVRSQRLEDYFGGVLSVAFAPWVPHDNYEAFMRDVARDFVGDFRLDPPGERPFYAPVFYVEPQHEGSPPPGFDLLSDPVRRTTLLQARESGEVTLSAQVAMPQRRRVTVALYAPVYRGEAYSVEQRKERLLGFVLAPLDIAHFMSDVLQREFPSLRVQVFDGDETGRRLYDSHPDAAGHAPLFTRMVDVPLARHGWTLRVSSLPRFEEGIDRSAEGLILGSGTIISTLLFAITLSLATTRKRAMNLARRYTQELDAERQRLREITATMGEGLYVQDQRDRITFANPAAEQLLGWRRDELIGMSSRRLVIRNGNGIGTHRHALERARAVAKGLRFAPERTEFRRKDGRTLPVSVVSTPILRDGKAEGSVVAFQDLRERVAVEQALRATEQFKALFEYASEAMFLSDAAGNILDVNRVGCVNLGYAREELIGQHPALFVHWSTLAGADEEQRFEKLIAQLRKGAVVMAEGELVRKDGTRYPAEASFSGINHGGQYRILVAARDISQRKEAERHVAEALAAVERSRAEVEDINRRLAESNRELQRLSRRDGLTGIANRRHFDEYLELEWRRAERDGRPLSLLIADVDHFKAFNDVYGHQAGDECLRRIAHTIDAQLSRSIDVTARYGGEEFAVILPETPLAGALNIAERMRGAVMGLRIRHEASPVSDFVTVSIGAASVIPRRGETPERLIGAADQALYDAKQGGRNRVCPAR